MTLTLQSLARTIAKARHGLWRWRVRLLGLTAYEKACLDVVAKSIADLPLTVCRRPLIAQPDGAQ